MADDPGASHAKHLAAVAGGAVGYAAGQTIGASIAVPVTTVLVVGGVGPAVLAFGRAQQAGAIGAYKLAKRLLEH